jgi:hypothetical protein
MADPLLKEPKHVFPSTADDIDHVCRYGNVLRSRNTYNSREWLLRMLEQRKFILNIIFDEHDEPLQRWTKKESKNLALYKPLVYEPL